MTHDPPGTTEVGEGPFGKDQEPCVLCEDSVLGRGVDVDDGGGDFHHGGEMGVFFGRGVDNNDMLVQEAMGIVGAVCRSIGTFTLLVVQQT
jgi:hypothetical protein